MKMNDWRKWLVLAVICWVAGLTPALSAPRPAGAAFLPGLEAHQFEVSGVTREALLHIPDKAKTQPTPVVFVFHGHGGTARNAARSFAFHTHWREAIIVYPQGLKTPGRLTDPEGKKSGWQTRPGDQADRDLAFFDALFAWLQKNFQVDTNRVYATGHSNGGMFTYLLWEARGDRFAAVAPSGAVAGLRGAVRLSPKPAMHVAGEKDTLVKFQWQKLTIDVVRKLNNCTPEGKPWAKHSTLYDSDKGTPLVTFIHPGGHEFPPAAPPQIARFFKSHPKNL